MYSCEKLARGSGFLMEPKKRLEELENEGKGIREREILTKELLNRNNSSEKYQNNFADPRKYRVKIELFEDRPSACVRRLKK